MIKKIILACTLLIALGGYAQTKDNMSVNTTQTTEAKGAKVVMHTSMGDIRILLYDDTPIHRDNFLKLAREGFYDGLLFHRVIKDFMIQGGDPNSRTADSNAQLGEGDTSYTLEAEFRYPTHFHKYGALAAARTPDQVNPEKRSSGSQFYIVVGRKYNEPTLKAYMERVNAEAQQSYFQTLARSHADEIEAMQKTGDKDGLETLRQELIKQTLNDVKGLEPTQEVIDAYEQVGGTPHLDGSYTVYGEVLEGMDVVEKIQNVEVNSSDRPLEDVKILTVTIEN
jgi:cyclophilin family peptidyl-prolyl cis-trans isomerase